MFYKITLAFFIAPFLLFASDVSFKNETIIDSKMCTNVSNKEYCTLSKITTLKSGVEWIDRILFAYNASDRNLKSTSIELLALAKKEAKNHLLESTEDLASEARGGEVFANEHSYESSMKLVSQNSRLITIRSTTYTYTGGAHGMHFTRYIVLDRKLHKQLSISDLLISGKAEELISILAAKYRENYEEYLDFWMPKDDELDRFLVENFRIEDEKIIFTYPLYELAPYSHGELELEASFDELEGVVDQSLLIN